MKNSRPLFFLSLSAAMLCLECYVLVVHKRPKTVVMKVEQKGTQISPQKSTKVE